MVMINEGRDVCVACDTCDVGIGVDDNGRNSREEDKSRGISRYDRVCAMMGVRGRNVVVSRVRSVVLDKIIVT